MAIERLRGWLGFTAGDAPRLYFKDDESGAVIPLTPKDEAQKVLLTSQHTSHRIVVTGQVTRDRLTGKPTAVGEISHIAEDHGEYQPTRR